MFSDNICSGGVFLKTWEPMDLNTPVQINFFLVVNSQAFEAKKRVSVVKVNGEVIRREKNGMAVRFYDDYRIDPFDYFDGAA